MEILHPRCAGLDVHKDTVVAAVRCVSEPRQHEVRSFATTTAGLLALADWLTVHGCTHVAMEATGVYWKPIWHVLEADPGPRQRPAHPQRPRPQDRRQ
jgi:transposase